MARRNRYPGTRRRYRGPDPKYAALAGGIEGAMKGINTIAAHRRQLSLADLRRRWQQEERANYREDQRDYLEQQRQNDREYRENLRADELQDRRDYQEELRIAEEARAKAKAEADRKLNLQDAENARRLKLSDEEYKSKRALLEKEAEIKREAKVKEEERLHKEWEANRVTEKDIRTQVVKFKDKYDALKYESEKAAHAEAMRVDPTLPKDKLNTELLKAWRESAINLMGEPQSYEDYKRSIQEPPPNYAELAPRGGGVGKGWLGGADALDGDIPIKKDSSTEETPTVGSLVESDLVTDTAEEPLALGGKGSSIDNPIDEDELTGEPPPGTYVRLKTGQIVRTK